jgi:exodeoxyribonuclease VII large subunit
VGGTVGSNRTNFPAGNGAFGSKSPGLGAAPFVGCPQDAPKLDAVLRPDDALRPFTVTELANEIRRELRPLTAVLVKGEVSGMKKAVAGHYNFSIGDGYSKLEAILWADASRRVTILPEDGQVFIFRGKIDFFAKNGRLSLVVDQVEFDDVGKLRARLEELKRRLDLEGAFDARRKRKLPFLPRTVAVLTSPTGAVINDLQETIWDRYPNMGIVVYPVQVQGAGAPMSVARALRRCNQEALADVIVLARGGGSFEEMYAFNTELVARAILDSRLPVVTALGHTSDRTVADLVADAECRTPTEAGARVVPKKADLEAQLQDRRRRLERELKQRVARYLERIERISRDLTRLSPIAQVARREEALKERRRRIDSAAAARLARSGNALAARRAPDRLDRALAERFAGATRALAHRAQRLHALSPDGVLARGYSITQDAESGAVITSAASTQPGRPIRVRLASGRLGARVEEVEP